jgi:hypothetical protein
MATPYQLFYEAIKTPATKKSYKIYIEKFLNYAHLDYDGLAKLSKDEISDLIFNYVIHLKGQTERTGSPNPNSYNPMLSPIQLFLEQSNILLNWKKIKRSYPKKIPSSNQLPYTDDDVRSLFEVIEIKLAIIFWKKISYDWTCNIPPASIATPLPNGMVILNPDGIIKTIPFFILRED